MTDLRYDDGRRFLHTPLCNLFLEAAVAYNEVVFDNGRPNRALCHDVFDIQPVGFDLVYLDPPYAPPKDDNDYIKRYHFLEGLSVYWRGQEIMHDTATKKIAKRFTPFAYKRTIRDALRRLFHHFRVSHEALQNQLRARIGTAAWIKIAQQDPLRIVRALEKGFNLVEEIRAQRGRQWSFADILLERYSSRSRAAGSILRGRGLEDEVETVAAGLGLSREMRTRFAGRGGRTAPCDIAIPRGGAEALIVGSAKGFNSTGSKLSDAVREVEEMASVRLPRQFVFAFVDGIGWLRRIRDLRRIFDLRANDEIDGLYSLALMDDFRHDLRTAALRLGLIDDRR